MIGQWMAAGFVHGVMNTDNFNITGETFDFKLETVGERVKVRGFLGVPLLGKSETWTKADPATVELCAAG